MVDRLKPHQFKKGQSGNPGGKPKLPKELKDIAQFTTHELQRIISKYFRMNKDQLTSAGSSEVLPMIEVAIARTIHVAAKNGDFSRLIPLVERICGKVKDQVEHDIGSGTAPQIVITLPSNGREVPEEDNEN